MRLMLSPSPSCASCRQQFPWEPDSLRRSRTSVRGILLCSMHNVGTNTPHQHECTAHALHMTDKSQIRIFIPLVHCLCKHLAGFGPHSLALLNVCRHECLLHPETWLAPWHKLHCHMHCARLYNSPRDTTSRLIDALPILTVQAGHRDTQAAVAAATSSLASKMEGLTEAVMEGMSSKQRQQQSPLEVSKLPDGLKKFWRDNFSGNKCGPGCGGCCM